ncbi:hypothetical protein FQA39_LY14394 [Lamprigera yunnana]|nr:hypothetical protein FQA39_LY14394 [Lamprigera yunnana]
MLETFEGTFYQFKQQLKEKENEIDYLHDVLHSKITIKLPEMSKEYEVQNDFRMVVNTDNFVPQITPLLKGLAQTWHAAKEISEEQRDRRNWYADEKRKPTEYRVHD